MVEGKPMTTKGNPGIGQPAKRVWDAIYVAYAKVRALLTWIVQHAKPILVTIIVAIGIGGLLTIIQIVQTQYAIESGNAAQATLIAIEGEQLVVQKEIATFQASSVRTGPTATAIAERVTQLKSTEEALEAERRHVEATLTAVAPQATNSTTLSSTPARVSSQVPGVGAELIELIRFQNTITIKVRFINSSEENQSLYVTFDSYLLDEATNKKYRVGEQSNGGLTVVPAGGNLEVWAKYLLPPEEVPQYLTVVLRHGILFEHIEVR